MKPSVVRADTHAAWNELIDTMIDYRIPAYSTETPRRTADRLTHDADLAIPAAAGVMLLARAEERARYARDPIFGGELGPALTDVRKALSARATLRAGWSSPSCRHRYLCGGGSP